VVINQLFNPLIMLRSLRSIGGGSSSRRRGDLTSRLSSGPVVDVDMTASRTDRSVTTHTSNMTRAEAVSNFLFDFNAAIAPKKVRMEAINFASELFCHRDAAAHDEELAVGAGNVMLAKLSYAYCVCPLDEEMAMTSVVFEMILGGASRVAVAKAFDEAGKSVIPLLVDIIQPPTEHCHPGKCQN
jgi:hypothetical protein